MAAALVCAVTAALSVSTDRSQYFIKDGFVVTCPNASWSVLRQTSSYPDPETCAAPWGKPQAGGCKVGPTKHSHSGSYWCQDKQKCTTTKIDITVSNRTVILESPLFPVKEGQNVTLKCSFKAKGQHIQTSDFVAAFYRNDEFQKKVPGGKMVLSPVSKADEGLYKCEHPSMAQSLESQLIVKEKPQHQAPPPPEPKEEGISLYRLLCFIFLFLLYTAILCIGLSVYCKWTRARAEEKKRDLERVSLRRVRNQ